MWKEIGFCDVNTPERLKTDAIVWYFCFHISQRVFAPTRISMFQFPALSFSQFVTIIDRTDLYYHFLDGDAVAHQGELVQKAEHLLRMREVLGSIPRFSSHVIPFLP